MSDFAIMLFVVADHSEDDTVEAASPVANQRINLDLVVGPKHQKPGQNCHKVNPYVLNKSLDMKNL